MTPELPLQGKRILIPRGEKQAKPFADLVKMYGGIPVQIPLIAFRPVRKTEKIPEISERLTTYDWIIFTSTVTVSAFFSLAGDLKIASHFAVIGEKTEQALRAQGYRTSFRPSEYVAEGFVKEFLPHITEGSKILLPKGNLAREYIAAALQEKGALVDEVVIYETYLPEQSRILLAEMLLNETLEVLVFTSPSTVSHFMEIVSEHSLHDKIKDCLIACIGPVTAEKASAFGLQADVVPEIYTVEEMVKGIINHIKNNR